ncbi:integral membrane protein pth11 [Fusarium heterosporum]|uniref:Integral membrane protein pth11 n=1 Tax=Fusarium heterosporum TaxID=42747 RepID=A0A8H5TUR1_FUSHE|nr:integral membrane protein pth11 [Fusarium heterosporum]
MTDPQVAQAIADGRVPKGITAEYLNETIDTPAIAGIILVTCLTSIVVLGRLASRAFLIRRFGVDDALTLLSWVCFVVFVGLCIKLIQLGSGRHFAYIEYVLDMPTVEYTEVLDFAAHIVYTTALLFCRMSGLVLYHRLCAIHDRLRLSIKIVFGVLVAGYIPQLFLIVFHCMPVTGLWPYEWQPGFADYTCLQWGLVYSVNSSVSLICDLLLFGIPVVMLRVLEMPRKRKIQLGCILLPGVSVIAISITRLVFVIEGQWNADMSWAYNPMLAIEVSEIGATLIALSVPGVKPLFDKVILRRDITQGESTGKSRYGKPVSSKGGTALRSLNFRPEHDVLASRDTSAEGMKRYRNGNTTRDNQSENSTEGILVQVDFQVKEDMRDTNSSNDASRPWK